MWKLNNAGSVLAIVAITALGAACDQEQTRTITEVQPPDTVTVTDTVRIVQTDTVRLGNEKLVFNQIERLGNPLVSEVLLEKRLHSFFNTTNPGTDEEFFRDDIINFVDAFRDRSLGVTIASVLLPDMLLVFPNRAAGVTAANVDEAGTVGWLTWALAPNNTGYGGRKLDNDDAVDKGLGAIFGTILMQEGAIPGLSTDNVPDTQQDPNTFPYVAPPN